MNAPEKIKNISRGFAVSLTLNREDSRKAERPSYDYIVETPPMGKIQYVLFEGKQYCPSPFDLGDNDKIIDGLLFFICLRPGDTEQEYFKDYTPEQMLWAQSLECEMISAELSEGEN